MRFTVICNGCDVVPQSISDGEIRGRLGISKDDFVFIFVGNISPNKNQSQVIDALNEIVSRGVSNIKCLFLGGGDVEILKAKVKSYNLTSIAFVLGFIDKSKLPDFYDAADATILTSLSEGFGLSIVEGYVYGKPNLTFADLPAVKDLYHKDAMLTCKDRDTASLADVMIDMSNRKWDKQKIQKVSKRFSYDIMSSKYIDFYRSTLKNR